MQPPIELSTHLVLSAACLRQDGDRHSAIEVKILDADGVHVHLRGVQCVIPIENAVRTFATCGGNIAKVSCTRNLYHTCTFL